MSLDFEPTDVPAAMWEQNMKERWRRYWIKKYHELAADRAFKEWGNPPVIVFNPKESK